MEIRTFSTFTHVRQTCFAYYFFGAIFKNLFPRIWNQHKILRFLIPFSKEKKFGPISTFLNFEAKHTKTAQKTY